MRGEKRESKYPSAPPSTFFNMTQTTKHSPQQVIEAIEGTGGIKSTIAKRLGVTRWTVDNYLKRWKSVQEAYHEEREKIVDMAETQLLEKIRSGDYPSIRFFLMTQAKERGYIERQEVTGAAGDPLKVIIEYANNTPDNS